MILLSGTVHSQAARPCIIELSVSNETLRKTPYINSRLVLHYAIRVNLKKPESTKNTEAVHASPLFTPCPTKKCSRDKGVGWNFLNY
jgi:hypothetical protein